LREEDPAITMTGLIPLQTPDRSHRRGRGQRLASTAGEALRYVQERNVMWRRQESASTPGGGAEGLDFHREHLPYLKQESADDGKGH